jgi:putative transcriptional regulator
MPRSAGGEGRGVIAGRAWAKSCAALLLLLGWLGGAVADPAPGRGMFLVATARLAHPLWRESVILLLSHDAADGSIGVILNRPLPDPLPDWFPGPPAAFAASELRLYLGGPVARDGLLFLLRSTHPPDGAAAVVEGLYHGPAHGLLAARLRQGRATSELRIFAGHAGWAPGQLAGELRRGDWRVLPADAESAFGIDSKRLWRVLTERSRQRWVHQTPVIAQRPQPAAWR